MQDEVDLNHCLIRLNTLITITITITIIFPIIIIKTDNYKMTVKIDNS